MLSNSSEAESKKSVTRTALVISLILVLALVGVIALNTTTPTRAADRSLKIDASKEQGVTSDASCVALGGTGCEANNGKCCRKGNPYTGTMRKCVNKGSFSSPVYTCVELEEFDGVKSDSCVALGGTGCEGNNGKCCRKGNPYTGTMRKCVNKGSFSSPVYTCVESLDEEGVTSDSCVALGGTGCEGNNGKCCRKGNPYTGTMRKCVNKGSFSSPTYTCVELDFDEEGVKSDSCIPLGGTGCEGNNAKCCRKGDPYTGTMRKCANTGSFSSPKYTCVQ